MGRRRAAKPLGSPMEYVLSSLTFQGRRSGALRPTTGLARRLRRLAYMVRMTSLRIHELISLLILGYVFCVVGDEVDRTKDTVKNGATSVPEATAHSEPSNSSAIPVPPPPPPPLSKPQPSVVPKKGKSKAPDIGSAAMMQELAKKVKARRSSRSREREEREKQEKEEAKRKKDQNRTRNVGKVKIPAGLTQPRSSDQASESKPSEDQSIPEPPAPMPRAPQPLRPEKKGPKRHNGLPNIAQEDLVADLKANGDRGRLKPKPPVAPKPEKVEPAKELRSGLKPAQAKPSVPGSGTPVNSAPPVGPQLLKQSKPRNSDPGTEAGTVPAPVPESIAKRQNLRSRAPVANSQPERATTGEVPGKHVLKSAATREQRRTAIEPVNPEPAEIEKPGPQNLKARSQPSTAQPVPEEPARPQFPKLKKAEPKTSGPVQSQPASSDIGPHRLKKTTPSPEKTADKGMESTAKIDPRLLQKAPRRIPEKKIPDDTAVKTEEGKKEVIDPSRLRKPKVNPGETVAAKGDGSSAKIDPRSLPKAPRKIPERKTAERPDETVKEVLGPERLRKPTVNPVDSTTPKGDGSSTRNVMFDPKSLPRVRSKRPPTTATEGGITPTSDARPGPQNLKPRAEVTVSQPEKDSGPKIPGQSNLRKAKREADSERQTPAINRDFRGNLRKAENTVPAPKANTVNASPAQETLERFKQRSREKNSQTLAEHLFSLITAPYHRHYDKTPGRAPAAADTIICPICANESVAGDAEVDRTNKVVKNETPASISASSPQAPPIPPPDSSLPQFQKTLNPETLSKPSKIATSITTSSTNSDLSLPNVSSLSQANTAVETNASKITTAQPLSTAKTETYKTTAPANQPEVSVPPSDSALPNPGNLEQNEVPPKSVNVPKMNGALAPIEYRLPAPQENETPVKENVPSLPSAYAGSEPKEAEKLKPSPEPSKAQNVDILPSAKLVLLTSSSDSSLPQTTVITEPTAVHSTPETRLPQTNVSEVPPALKPQNEKHETSTVMKSTVSPVAESAAPIAESPITPMNSTSLESRKNEKLQMPPKLPQTSNSDTLPSVASEPKALTDAPPHPPQRTGSAESTISVVPPAPPLPPPTAHSVIVFTRRTKASSKSGKSDKVKPDEEMRKKAMQNELASRVRENEDGALAQKEDDAEGRPPPREEALSDKENVPKEPPPIPKAPPLPPPPPKPEAKVKLARPNDAARAASQRKKEEAERQIKAQGLIQELRVKGSRESLRKTPTKQGKTASIESPARELRNSLKPRARAPSSSSAQLSGAGAIQERVTKLKSTADRSTRLEPLNEEENLDDDLEPGKVEIPGRQKPRNARTPSESEKTFGAKESTDISALRKGLMPASSRASLRPAAPETSAMSHLPSRQNPRNLAEAPSGTQASPGSETPDKNEVANKSNEFLLRRRSSLRPAGSRPPKPAPETPDINTVPGQNRLKKTSMATLRSERTDITASTNVISGLRAGLKPASSRPNLKSPSPETPAMRSIPSQQNLRRVSQRVPSTSETDDAQKSVHDISGLRGKLKPAASRASLRPPQPESSDTLEATNPILSRRSTLKSVKKSAPETPTKPSEANSDPPEKSTRRAVQHKKTSVNQNRRSELPPEAPNFRGQLTPVAEGNESETSKADDTINAGGTDFKKRLSKAPITDTASPTAPVNI
ncbi:hypothetical protein DdX_18226 [Ditylenchus destructor]|uniref:Uncharacterized protein n=1 Tax=Ditylenchus destructor TaxID=166010 RepID=A0AAD4MK41_9BILA|nr:hypothetical protein DdX_18226 [Ditylenchus destructor]